MTNYKDQLADELYKAVKELNECLNSSKLDAVLQKYEDQKNRQTGRTTILYMKAIVKALENPGKTVEFIDHYEHNWDRSRYHRENLKFIIKQLGYNIIAITKGQAQVYLYNEFEPKWKTQIQNAPERPLRGM
jgi:CCR4-NOT transcriptional regulation complex NOT5 subunit